MIGWLNDCIQYGYWSIEQLINPLSWTVNKSLIFPVLLSWSIHTRPSQVSQRDWRTHDHSDKTRHTCQAGQRYKQWHIFIWMLEYSYLFTIRTWSLPKQQQQQQKWNKIYKKLKKEEEEDTKHDTPNIITADKTWHTKRNHCRQNWTH